MFTDAQLAFQLDPGHEEEHGQQPVGRPVPHRQVQAQGWYPEVEVAYGRVRRAPRAVRPDQREDSRGEKDQATGVWVVPRLTGRAKAAMVAIEYDEFGACRAERIHARLFADLLADLGLDTGYGRYLDHAPAPLLATVNLMSLFGLHRALHGALVGHFACVEVTSSPGSKRLANAMRRCGAGAAAEHFYAEHVEADAVHEQVVRRDVIGGLLADEPALEADVAFGCAATILLEDRLADHIREAWDQDRSAMRRPLPDSGPARQEAAAPAVA